MSLRPCIPITQLAWEYVLAYEKDQTDPTRTVGNPNPQSWPIYQEILRRCGSDYGERHIERAREMLKLIS